MGLINLLTDLTDFKFYAGKGYPGDGSKTGMKSIPQGHDRRGGGNSNQPYITTPIPEKLGEFGYLNQDFILRGGSKAVTDSALDVVRLSKYFTDVRNPSGILFTVKQNLLSRMAVRTQSSTGILNNGIYTPLSTLIEAGGVAFGLHVNKQGLNPFGGVGGITKYEDAVRLTNTSFTAATTSTTSVGTGFISGPGASNFVTSLPTLETTISANLRNRLVGLWNDKIAIDNSDINVLSYKGGPGSFLGIGNTNIKFAGSSASERTGANNPLLKTNKEFFLGKGNISSTQFLNREGNYENIKENINLNISRFQGLSYYWDNTLAGMRGISAESYLTNNFLPRTENDEIIPSLSIISSIVANDTTNLLDPNNNKAATFTAEQIAQTSTPTDITAPDLLGLSQYVGGINGYSNATIPGDFRRNLRVNNPLLQQNRETVGNVADAPDYTGEYKLELRTSLGDPGNRAGKNLTSYTNGFDNSGAAAPLSYDKINASEINDVFDDLVNFTIKVIDNDTFATTTIQFRAFLNQISDAYSADWNATKYLGRGENFYTYGGFDRKVSLSWTIAAQSKIELIPMYKKLNYLASIVTPDYSPVGGYMRGNLVKLTVGGYFYDQPGIITGFSYDMNDDNATWEIGIDDEGFTDDTVKQLPHLIKVSGFNFIPIHTFVPKIVQSTTNTQQKYIALRNPNGNNYE
jgi:hypothetical protein